MAGSALGASAGSDRDVAAASRCPAVDVGHAPQPQSGTDARAASVIHFHYPDSAAATQLVAGRRPLAGMTCARSIQASMSISMSPPISDDDGDLDGAGTVRKAHATRRCADGRPPSAGRIRSRPRPSPFAKTVALASQPLPLDGRPRAREGPFVVRDQQAAILGDGQPREGGPDIELAVRAEEAGDPIDNRQLGRRLKRTRTTSYLFSLPQAEPVIEASSNRRHPCRRRPVPRARRAQQDLSASGPATRSRWR